MIITFLLYIFSWLLQLVFLVGNSLAFALQMPYITAQFVNAAAWLLAPAYYWAGVMPVTAMLNFVGYVVGFYSSLFVFNVVWWVWSKFPTISTPK